MQIVSITHPRGRPLAPSPGPSVHAERSPLGAQSKHAQAPHDPWEPGPYSLLFRRHHPGDDKILLALLPRHRRGLARCREVLYLVRLPQPPHELLP